MERGRPFPPTATSGCRRRCLPAGRRIAMDTGRGSLPGDGPGWMMRHGGSLPSTMAVGCTTTTTGDGLLVLSAIGIRTMLRRWSAGSADPVSGLASAGDGAEAGALASALAGIHWVGVPRITRTTADGAMAAITTADTTVVAIITVAAT